MHRRTLHRLTLAATLALVATGTAYAQQTIRLTAAGGHPPVFLWVKLIDEFFIPEVDKRLAAAGGQTKIDWTRAWGGTLIKIGSESKGIADGVADIGFVGTIFEAPRFPLQNVSYFAPFGSNDIGTVTKVVNQLQHDVPAMGGTWTKNGLVYLGGAALDVTDPEPLLPADPLLQAPNLIVLPHIGSAGKHTRARMADICVDNILAALAGEPVPSNLA